MAERQGQTAVGKYAGTAGEIRWRALFWSQHYDVPINYVGHAETWDEIAVDGDITARIACFGTRTRAVYLPLHRSIAISEASRPNLNWSEQRVERSPRCLSSNNRLFASDLRTVDVWRSAGSSLRTDVKTGPDLAGRPSFFPRAALMLYYGRQRT
jgi:hypothetical protein